MKTIKQLSAELGISKEAVYKKLRFQLREQLESHITKVDNVTHIDEEGEEIIRQSLCLDRREALEGVIEGGSTAVQPHLTEYIQLLQNQLKTKDVQIEAQNGHIGLLINQLGGNRMLAKAERLGVLTAVGAGESSQRRKPLWKRIFRR